MTDAGRPEEHVAAGAASIAPAKAPTNTPGDAASAPSAEGQGAGSPFGAVMSRRQALQLGAAALPCMLGSGAIFAWMSRLTAGTSDRVDPIVADYDPTTHRWGFVVDASACIGCGKCVVACKQENNVPADAEHTRTWVERHSVTAGGRVIVDSPEAGIDGFPPESAPAASDPPDGEAIVATRFVPRLCMQCENPPCVGVCPVGATYRTPDGVILVDEERCIGCGYCIIACPYGARYLVPAGDRTPTGIAGVADKCTFCYHRITRGRKPACVDVCPVGARRFGDLDDPTSDVSTILRSRPTRVMRPELGTNPRVHYVGLEGEQV